MMKKDSTAINYTRDEEELFLTLNALPYAILLIQEDQIIYFANTLAHEWVGASNLSGVSCTICFCCEEDCVCSNPIDKMAKVLPEAVTRIDGKKFPVLKTTQPIILKGRKYFLEILIDNSSQAEEQKKLLEINQQLRDLIREKEIAEEKARKESEKFEQLFEEVADAIMMHDFEGAILKVNKKACNRLGYSKSELESMNIKELDSNKFRREVDTRIQTLKKEKFLKFESENITRNGDLIPVEIYSKVINFESQEVILSSVRNIKRRKQYEQELIEAKKRAEQSDKLKDQFLNNISHEIRTPLNGIVGFLDFLEDDGVSADQRKEYVKIMRKSSNRLIETVTAILEISKMESGLVNPKNEEFVLSEELDSFINESDFAYNSSEVDFLYELPSDLKSIKVNTDKNNLRLVLKHLLDNAFKFTEKGSVSLLVNNQGLDLKITVEDTGVGINENDLEEIFKPFRKSNDSWTNAIDGNGLGLTIAKKLVDSMGGNIEVTSQQGKGADFSVILPNVLLKPDESGSSAKSTKSLKGRTILVVEDEMSNFLYIEAVLKKQGAHIIHAKDGEQALSHGLNGHVIDVILMDLRIPKISGFEVTRQLKKAKPDIPIIAHSAFILNNERDTAIKCGCNDFLAKPVKAEALLKKVLEYLP